MKLAVLVLSAFTGLPSGHGAATDPAFPTGVGQADSWILGIPGISAISAAGLIPDLGPDVSETWLLPEPPPGDDVLPGDLSVDPEPAFPYVFSGCELSLRGSLAPDEWVRDLWLGAPLAKVVPTGHTEKDGHWLDYDQIPRRPGRPEDYAAYRYPVIDAPVVSGYDLDKPDDEQRRGHMNAVGHGGVDLMAPMGTPISMLRLEHQVGQAEVLYVGTFYGETVITRHVVREGGVNRDYILIFGHLDRAADDVRRGVRLREGATLGFVGNTSSPELVHLHLEARRVRPGVDAWRMPTSVYEVRDLTVVTDPRNVLPLRNPRPPISRCKPRLSTEPRTYWLGDAMKLTLDEPASDGT